MSPERAGPDTFTAFPYKKVTGLALPLPIYFSRWFAGCDYCPPRWGNAGCPPGRPALLRAPGLASKSPTVPVTVSHRPPVTSRCALGRVPAAPRRHLLPTRARPQTPAAASPRGSRPAAARQPHGPGGSHRGAALRPSRQPPRGRRTPPACSGARPGAEGTRPGGEGTRPGARPPAHPPDHVGEDGELHPAVDEPHFAAPDQHDPGGVVLEEEALESPARHHGGREPSGAGRQLPQPRGATAPRAARGTLCRLAPAGALPCRPPPGPASCGLPASHRPCPPAAGEEAAAAPRRRSCSPR